MCFESVDKNVELVIYNVDLSQRGTDELRGHNYWSWK